MRVPGLFRVSSRFMSAAVALVLSVPLLGWPNAHASSVVGAETETSDVLLARASLAPASALIVADAETASFSLEIQNDESDALRVNSVAFFVDRDRVVSSADLAQRLSDIALPADIDIASASLPAETIAAGDRSVQTLETPVSALLLPEVNGAGVYLMYARVAVEGGEPIVAATPFVWQGTGVVEQTPLHTVVPLVLPSTIDGMPNLSELSELTSSDGRLASTAAAAIGFGSTLAIDPRLIAATDTFGESAPTSANILLAQLQAAANPTFALQFADADLSSQGQLGLAAPLTPQGFGYLVDEPARDIESSFAFSLPGVAWPRENSVTTEALSFMERSGFSTVLMSSDNLSASQETGGSLGSSRVLAFTQVLQDSAAAALSGETAIARSAGSARLVSHLALINQGATPSIPLNLGLDRAGASVRDAAPLLETLSALPWLQPVGIEAVLSQQGSFSVKNQPVAPEQLEVLRKALDNEPVIDTYGSVLVTPIFLTQLQRMRVLEFFAASVAPDTPGYADRVTEYFERDSSTLQAVRITTSSTTNLVGTSTRLPIQISNDLPFAALVTATTVAANSSLLVEEPESAPTTIAQKSSVNITVPVRARVSAGQTSLVVTIFAQDGLPIDDAVLDVNIRSSWESVALSVLGLLVASFFGFGIWRSIRSKRQQALAQDSSPNQS
jgi:hypothetical protein